MERGLFVVVDGLDGIGKGVIERIFREYEERDRKAVLDTIAFARAHERLPEISDFFGNPTPHYNVLITAEPTHIGIGDTIRRELIAKNGREYSFRTQLQAYAIDRLVQMQRVVVPALERGLTVIQSRSVATSLVYQTRIAIRQGLNPEEVRKEILTQEGNEFQLSHAPQLLVIPTIRNVQELESRLNNRDKQDNAIFENLPFQKEVKPEFESAWLREIFEKKGTKIAYLDAGISEEETRRQAREIYTEFIKTRKIPEEYTQVKDSTR